MNNNTRLWFWAAIIIAVLVMLGIFQIIRVNEEPAKNTLPPVSYTRGPVITGPVNVSAGQFLSYRINLNRPGTLKGSFDSLSVKLRIELLVLDDDNFDKWKKGEDYKAIAETGHLPVANISPRLQPGIYHLVLSGRKNADKNISIETDFSVD